MLKAVLSIYYNGFTLGGARMNAPQSSKSSDDQLSASERIGRYSGLLSGQLQLLREQPYPPEAQKTLRTFSSVEVARILGLSESTIRQLDLDKEGPTPARLADGRRAYTLEQINDVRRVLAKRRKPEDAWQVQPSRRNTDVKTAPNGSNLQGKADKL